MQIKKLNDKKIKNICDLLKKYGFKVSKNIHQIIFTIGFRTFYLNSIDSNDPYFLTTDIDIDLFISQNYFLKTKHSKTYQDKRFNEKMDLDEATEVLEWEIVDVYGIKDFDLNPTIEEPIAESLFHVKIKETSHIILDDNVYVGDPQGILSLIKPTALDALISLTNENIIQEIMDT